LLPSDGSNGFAGRRRAPKEDLSAQVPFAPRIEARFVSRTAVAARPTRRNGIAGIRREAIFHAAVARLRKASNGAPR
jgi:hypothetical protein